MSKFNIESIYNLALSKINIDNFVGWSYRRLKQDSICGLYSTRCCPSIGTEKYICVIGYAYRPADTLCLFDTTEGVLND